jgi:hypothetical protein
MMPMLPSALRFIAPPSSTNDPEGRFTKLPCAALQKKILHRGISTRFLGEFARRCETRAGNWPESGTRRERRLQRISILKAKKRAVLGDSPEGVLGKITLF